MSMEYTIRQGRREDAPGMLKLALGEGWNQVIEHLHIPFDCFPEGVFVAESKDGEIVSMCASAALDDSNGFMAYYVTQEPFRRRGIGRQLFDLSYKALGNRNVGLDAALDRQDMYAAANFKIATFTLVTCEFPIKNLLQVKEQKSCCKIVDVKDIDIQKLLAYDIKIHTIPREQIVRWTLAFATACRVALDGDEIKGWGALCKTNGGHRLMPLYANTPNVAEDLAGDLLKQVAGDNQEAEIEICYPEDNMAAKKLFSDLGAFSGECRYSKHRRMYTRHDVPVPTDLVYSIMNYEQVIV